NVLIKTAVITLGFLLGAALIFLVTRQLIGQGISHGGNRKRIVGHFPMESQQYTFQNTGNEISTRSTKFIFHVSTFLQNLRYYFVGRFTGLLVYFFPAFVSLILALPIFGQPKTTRSPPGRLSFWLVCLGLILFHIIYIPSNYHGGSCSIGNRYLISYLPAFFFLLKESPKSRTLLFTALVTALLTGPIALNPVDSMASYRDVSKRATFEKFPLEISLLNSWPIDDTGHVRVDFKDYYIYFADDNHWGKELDGFWVKGNARASFVLRCWKPVTSFHIHLRNGASDNTLMIRLGKAVRKFNAEPGQHISGDIEPGKPELFYNLEGRPSYCYRAFVETEDGFIPKFSEPGSTDTRFLGVFVQIQINS
ncbi:hypothetical protein JW979_03755, partial [bacterium]|nr:hypothetical protein [candidate division CSSED10-310 bacterium]